VDGKLKVRLELELEVEVEVEVEIDAHWDVMKATAQRRMAVGASDSVPHLEICSQQATFRFLVTIDCQFCQKPSIFASVSRSIARFWPFLGNNSDQNSPFRIAVSILIHCQSVHFCLSAYSRGDSGVPSAPAAALPSPTSVIRSDFTLFRF